MGGKRLKFPARQKFVDTSKDAKFKDDEEPKVSKEEEERRIKMLKDLGLIK